MNRSAGKVMGMLIGLIKPLLHIMVLAVSMGVIGYLCAIFITILGGMGLLKVVGFSVPFSLKFILTSMIICAVVRGLLRYSEQAANHYIAFKLLALIRHKVFVKLRELSPAKLEGKEKGNLISIITSDIELLEVFYAHTISPIAIATITSVVMVIFIGQYHIVLGVIAFVAYFVVGVILPVTFSRAGAAIGQNYRDEYGKMNSFFLDSIRGLKESIQFNHGEKRLEEINSKTDNLRKQQEQLKRFEGLNRAVTDSAVLIFSSIMLFAGVSLNLSGSIGVDLVVITTIAMLSSFGPVVALSNLSNNLHHTIASGNRVLDLLEEEPVVREVEGNKPSSFGEVKLDHVSFSYNGTEAILEDIDMTLSENQIIGIHGKSGSGKSTLLKLLMRFWEAEKGKITIDKTEINQVNTKELRDMEAYVTQDTYLFNDTLAANIAVAKEGAAMEDIITAAKKASVHDFISGLPNGYETKAGELGDHLSGGEKQRIGVARAFLHDASLVLLDEPTSNLDSLNEAIILKALKEESMDKTLVLVSHRKSTMNIADEVYQMESARIS